MLIGIFSFACLIYKSWSTVLLIQEIISYLTCEVIEIMEVVIIRFGDEDIMPWNYWTVLDVISALTGLYGVIGICCIGNNQ